MDKVTRLSCKLCRFTKCKSAGMVLKWVVSAHIPRVGKKKCLAKKDECIDNNENISTTDKQIEEHFEHLSISRVIADTKKNYNQAFSIDKKVRIQTCRYFVNKCFFYSNGTFNRLIKPFLLAS